MRVLLVIAAVPALCGCLDRELKPINPCTQSGFSDRVRVQTVDKIDLLFMIDNSNSMAQEQASLALQIPRLVRVLATGDRNPELDADGDGDPADVGDDFQPVRSLQVGVVSSDMGTGGFNVDTCADSNFGNDGELQTQGDVSTTGCMATYPRFLSFDSDTVDPDTFARDVNCVAALGTGGCGFEQQLEAVLKAVTPSTCTEPWCTFTMGTRGHADRANTGFVRGPLTDDTESLLAVIMLTDEEDCSVADPDLFNPSSTTYRGVANLRCFLNPTAVHATNRFVEGLLATRSSPDLIVFAAIAGVPTDFTTSTASFDQILAHPDMQEMIDPLNTNNLRPSCNVPSRGTAMPPRRIVTVARDLALRGANSVVHSICQADYTPALDQIIDKLVDALDNTCLPRALNPDDAGLVDCFVVETLPAVGRVTRCTDVPGREPIGTETEGGVTHEVCRVRQLSRSDSRELPGWFYESSPEGSSCAQRLQFTPGAEPVTGTLVRLECLQPVTAPAGPAAVDIDTPCEPTVDSMCPAGTVVGDRSCPMEYTVSCDSVSRTWERLCTSDADCAAGWRCDTSRVAEGAGAICRNPTCG